MRITPFKVHHNLWCKNSRVQRCLFGSHFDAIQECGGSHIDGRTDTSPVSIAHIALYICLSYASCGKMARQ